MKGHEEIWGDDRNSNYPDCGDCFPGAYMYQNLMNCEF